MSYFAAVLARTEDGWTAQEVSLESVQTIDDVAELMRDIADDSSASVLFVEEDDEYVGIVRVIDDDDPRVFLSHPASVADYDLAGILADGVTGEDGDYDEDDPLGDPAVVADLGTPARDLLALVRHEGTLPSDVITTVCERAGCLDELEALRVP